MGDSNITVEKFCCLCSCALNITEYEQPYRCKNVMDPWVCGGCYKRLRKKVCIKCSKDIAFDKTTYNQMLSDTRAIYILPKEQDLNNFESLKRDMNKRKKLLKQLVDLTSNCDLDPDLSSNVFLIEKQFEAQELYDELNILCQNLDQNNVNESRTRYKGKLSSNHDQFIFTCEYLRRIYETSQKQKILPGLASLVERFDDSNGDGDITSCKRFIETLVEDLEKVKNRLTTLTTIRVGFIGGSKQGKSSLCNYLRGLYGRSGPRNEDCYATTEAASPTTMCSIPYIHEVHDPSNDGEIRFRIEYVDIRGWDDAMNDDTVKELIKKDDCDIYLLLRNASPFTRADFDRKTFIEEESRICIFVQTHVDETFEREYEECYGRSFDSNVDDAMETFREVVEKIRRNSLKLLLNNKIPANDIDVCLVGCPWRSPVGIENKHNYYVRFDLDRIESKIIERAKLRAKDRLKLKVMRAGAYIVEMNFKRNYTIWSWQRALRCGVSAIIPFLDIWHKNTSIAKIQKDFGLDDNYKSYLEELTQKYHTGRFATDLDNETRWEMNAASATRSGAATVAAATKVAVFVKGAAIIGATPLTWLMIPAVIGITGIQAIYAPFKEERQLDAYISAVCEHMNEVLKTLVDAILC